MLVRPTKFMVVKTRQPTNSARPRSRWAHAGDSNTKGALDKSVNGQPMAMLAWRQRSRSSSARSGSRNRREERSLLAGLVKAPKRRILWQFLRLGGTTAASFCY